MARLIDVDATIHALNVASRGDSKDVIRNLVICFLLASPTVDAVPVIRCKDCKHFETDHFENVNGIPLIVAHDICVRWGDGCKTSPDGYCFMAERKEDETD